jgi:hypothetical protein
MKIPNKTFYSKLNARIFYNTFEFYSEQTFCMDNTKIHFFNQKCKNLIVFRNWTASNP